VRTPLPAIAILMLLACSAALADPHLPTEDQVKRKLGEVKDEPDRTYQRDSVEGFGQKTVSAAGWVKEKLAALHITPARLMVGLGILGILFTWNKNKKKTHWALVSGVSFLLAIFGAAAIFLKWTAFN